MNLKTPWRKALGTATAALALALSMLLPATSAHAAPAAGTVIGNQASATYKDGSGTDRTTTSNLVQTTVQQVKNFTLTAPGARTAAPGQSVYYPHVITNTGNGNDTYTLNAASAAGTFTHTGLAYYADANGDGVPDNAVAITTTGVIAAGGQFRFVVAAVVPGGAALGTTGTVTVSVSDTTGAPATTNLDTTTVAASAVAVTKNLGVTSGPSPNSNILVTLAYTNSGTAAATNLVITDTLPTGMTYVAESGKWGAQTVFDTAADPAGINYVYDSATGKITVTVDNVPAGGSGQVTFRVNINAGLSPTNSSLGNACLTAGCPALTTNTASYVTSTQTSSVNTNSITYSVLQTGSVILNGSATAPPTSGAGEPIKPTIAGASDYGSIAQGGTVSFPVYAWNTGNGTDTVNIVLSTVAGSNTFPSGTTFALFRSDGTTPLIDTNGDGRIDTGPLAAGSSLALIVKATLPSNATTGNNGGNGFTAVFDATSVFTPGVPESTTVKLGTILANTVDATIDGAYNAGTPAIGQTATGATSVQTKNVTPAQSASTTTVFKLYVNNTGAAADTYNLSATGVPTGWTLQFRADGGSNDCSTTGAALTNTGNINKDSSRLVCAVVTVPSIQSGNAGPVSQDLQLTAQSSSTTASNDIVTVTVAVQTVHAVSLSPNGIQQTYPAAAVTYNHTLTNIGNVSETVKFAPGFLTDAQQAAGWTSTAYLDANNNGVLDLGTDTLIADNATVVLTVGTSKTIFVRVFSPASATPTSPADVTTLTATYNTTLTATVTDTTGITEGLLLVKEQASTACNATPAAASYSINPIGQSTATEPGKCIGYRITATNTTAQTITNVVVSDNVPANTTLNTGCGAPAASTGTIGGTATATGNTGTVTATVANLAPNASFTASFCVQINP